MALPLSPDLRAWIVGAVSEGSSIRQAAAGFDVSPSSAIKLMQRGRATGSTAPGRIAAATGGRCWRVTRRSCAS